MKKTYILVTERVHAEAGLEDATPHHHKYLFFTDSYLSEFKVKLLEEFQQKWSKSPNIARHGIWPGQRRFTGDNHFDPEGNRIVGTGFGVTVDIEAEVRITPDLLDSSHKSEVLPENGFVLSEQDVPFVMEKVHAQNDRIYPHPDSIWNGLINGWKIYGEISADGKQIDKVQVFLPGEMPYDEIGFEIEDQYYSWINSKCPSEGMMYITLDRNVLIQHYSPKGLVNCRGLILDLLEQSQEEDERGLLGPHLFDSLIEKIPQALADRASLMLMD